MLVSLSMRDLLFSLHMKVLTESILFKKHVRIWLWEHALFVLFASLVLCLSYERLLCYESLNFVSKGDFTLAECNWNVAVTSLFLLLHIRKSFACWYFAEISILLKSRNHFNFLAPNKCGFLFKPSIFCVFM